MAKRLRTGDWEVTQLSPDCLHADQMDWRGSFSAHRLLNSEDDVKAFVAAKHLTLIGERTHGTWPVRQYCRER